MEIFIADRQGITCAGLMYIIDRMSDCSYKYVEDKASLLCQLPQDEPCVVIIDFTLFDFNDISELMIVAQRFRQAHWLLFSEDLSIDFARQIAAESYSFSIVMKESPLTEIREAIQYAVKGHRFFCQRIAEMLITVPSIQEEKVKLTKTETEILKCMALGMTTKEIAEKRFSSFHTVNTHRKNIFRKLGVNTVHEATKYALRAGLVDSAEYYI